MSHTKRNTGFDGRRFLDLTEWLTYCKRKPVRYIRTAKMPVCDVCGKPGSTENPLQNAHIIGFDVGVIDLGLTPDFLDSDENIKTAHPKRLQQTDELDLQGSMDRLRELGEKELPQYLPAWIHETWGRQAEPRG